MSNLYGVILAAGQGTRMKSKHSKVMHALGGKPMVGHVVDGLKETGVNQIILVVGHQAEEVKEYLGDQVEYVMQEKQKGTAHAVLQASSILANKQGTTLIVMGDSPLITSETLRTIIAEHQAKNTAATILTTKLENPTGYGRIIRDESGNVVRIVEEKDATSDEKIISEVNTGTYCFDNEKLFSALMKVKNDNVQGEYYLTDVIEILRSEGETIGAYQTLDANETIGINDRMALAKAEEILRTRLIEQHMKNGVTIIDPKQTYIEKGVVIGSDTIIYPNTYLRGNTMIGQDCVIGPNVELTDTNVADEVKITNSVVYSAEIANRALIGPYAYIRPGTEIGDSVKVGDFVEIKNSKIGQGTKVPHLSYIGDTTLGENVNIGAGTITVNYDGYRKHRTEIGDRSFIGCNTNLVAPVKVGNDVYVAAGSTITDNIPDFTLAIARERQVNKEGYVKKIRERNNFKDK
ncbi:bifunctional UDP-N-acetylglucosamine diphosphorylase/glucosamine-1-phosphate N-acetyltransferase GlmU [Tepidibacillus fermentans]|uniref:Bifunctional protein GlmU n=1 Tax=Tepidibacillus fermentans TaxID=1281767 RepID=A0A4R3KAN0_9BACI|nr:bifunctional UDP-N-acetylglucosamine diphosphorylase/glucosamine-1-phosphate N-acetyltransferase GlmU [Tepidibacillus fermentans]TCS80166.1 UDP-N-acetylglucosamine pyrophosphorylase /glucosamine-1-phosphate N-acetyltransferase [Tepidibacillus fermentans]